MTDLEMADSTLIRRGTEASTFKDMVEYAETLENRPVIRLLEELPGLAALSESKFHLAVHVLRRRFRKEAEVDRLQLTILAREIAESVEQPEIAGRIRSIFVEPSHTAAALVEARA
jgi:hypothetical protein